MIRVGSGWEEDVYCHTRTTAYTIVGRISHQMAHRELIECDSYITDCKKTLLLVE